MMILLLRHISFFKGQLGLMQDFEIYNYACLRKEKLALLLQDSKESLHFEKVKDLELFMELQQTGGFRRC